MSIVKGTTNDPAVPRADWDSETNDLVVRFASGNVYRFNGVPKTAYKELTEKRDPLKYIRSQLMMRYDFTRESGPSE